MPNHKIPSLLLPILLLLGCVGWLRAEEVKPDLKPVITHRYHYTDFQEGFEVMKTGQSGKVVLNWN